MQGCNGIVVETALEGDPMKGVKNAAKGRYAGYLTCLVVGFAWASQANAVTLTFDEVISGATSYEFDADGDTLPDAVFTTTDTDGFNTTGPGPNQSYIVEPGLEGTTLISPDLRVDFPNTATGSLGFGFAVSAVAESPDLTVTFQVFDSGNNLLASSTALAAYTEPSPPTPSSFPEGLIDLSFSGAASYATFDFNDTDASRYIIDNFTGTFGSTENPPGPVVPVVSPVPVPTLSTWGIALSILGFLLLAASRFRKSANIRGTEF
jgi:hypothetical protein